MNDHRTRELYERYTDALEPWQVKLAIARMKRYRVPLDAWDDTMQELVIVVHEHVFDPAKAHAASERTILCRTIDNRIRTLARTNARYRACMERIAQLPQATHDGPVPDQVVVEQEVRRLVGELTPLQRDICLALMDGQSIHQIAQRAGRAWNTIEREISRIRCAFIERGMTP